MIQKYEQAKRGIVIGLGGAATWWLLVGWLNSGQLTPQAAALPASPTVTATSVKPANHTYTGTSRKGDINEAIQAAIGQVPVPCCDRVVSWTLKGVSGQRGGIDGRNRVTVTIEANID